MRVKVFQEHFHTTLEDTINAWLDENPGIKIVNVVQSQSRSDIFKETENIITMAVWYEE